MTLSNEKVDITPAASMAFELDSANEAPASSVATRMAQMAQKQVYAALHGELYGDLVDAGTLIPYMLEAFMARDRTFRRA